MYSLLDVVVLSVGVRPNTGIIEEIKENFGIVKVIGDVNKPRKIAHAITEGFDEAYNLEVKELVLQ